MINFEYFSVDFSEYYIKFMEWLEVTIFQDKRSRVVDMRTLKVLLINISK